jgi:hypothetical protein
LHFQRGTLHSTFNGKIFFLSLFIYIYMSREFFSFGRLSFSPFIGILESKICISPPPPFSFLCKGAFKRKGVTQKGFGISFSFQVLAGTLLGRLLFSP